MISLRLSFAHQASRRLHPALLLFALFTAACDLHGTRSTGAGIDPVYDEKTGRLQLLKYDSDRNGMVDAVSYMDGARVVRIEIDKDEDGKVERWEYYAADQTIEKVGFSRAGDGREDAWSFSDPDGAIARVEISTRRDGRVTRTEFYAQEAVIRAEEDADFDGRVDRWETYEDGRLTMVAFDTAGRGIPDRRLVYMPDGAARLEVDPDGDGEFVVQ